MARDETIRVLHKAITDGFSPVRLVEDCLENIASRNAAIRAMIYVDEQGALEAARILERELNAGRHRGPLHGIPIAVKDVIDVKGCPTTSGSHVFDGYIAPTDADCIANLKAAGAIIIGKTNLHELTVGAHDNPWFGKVVNPLDPSRGTGGTSSGSAAAVAAGFCVAAVGTDTGGSNRSTAAATGLFGFKPTNGLVPSTGVRPTAPSLDTIGPLARNAEDVWLTTMAMQGGAPRAVAAEAPPLEGRRKPVLGLCPDLLGGRVDPAVHRDISMYIAGLNADLAEIGFDHADDVEDAGLIILQYEFAAAYGHEIERQPDSVGEGPMAFARAGRSIDTATYERARQRRAMAKSIFLEQMAKVDALLVPTCPGRAPLLSDETTEVGDSRVPYGQAGGRFRRWANMFDMPALAMPIPAGAGLPASVQIAAPPGQDWKLFSIVTAMEKA